MSKDPAQDPEEVGANPLLEEAVGWCLRMNGPDADHHRTAFDNWLALGGVHRQIYSEVSELYGFGGTLRPEDLARSSPAEPVKSTEGSRAHPHVTLALIGALAVVVMTVGALYFEWHRRETAAAKLAAASEASVGQLQTGLADIRAMRLHDGSVLTLDTDSLVTFDLNGRERRIRLERGRVRFNVHPEARPFSVVAGDRTITAQGTIFDVSLAEDQTVDVTLLRGAVLLRPLGQPATMSGASSRLQIGYQATYQADNILKVRRSARADFQASQWPTGLMSFEGVPLAEVIRQANRYALVKIYVSDPSLGERKFFGTLRMQDTRALAKVLAHAFSLKIIDSPAMIQLAPR